MDAKRYPLTHPQKRVWYTEQLYLGTALHNITGSVRIRGSLRFELLSQAIREQIRKHDALRLRFATSDGTPEQYVVPAEEAVQETAFVDFSTTSDPEAEWQSWVAQRAATPFSLEGGPLCAFPMYRIAEGDGGFLVQYHHIVSDGWSSTMLIAWIRDAYERLLRGEPPEDEPAPSYFDYINREVEYFASARFKRDGQFWRDKFAGWPGEERPSAIPESLEGTRKTYALGIARSAAIQTLLHEAGCSLTAWFHLIVALHVRKTEGRAETVIGMPVFNRSGPKEKATIGMFTSTMPLRIATDGESSAKDLLLEIQRELTSCYYRQKYPYDLLVQDLQLKQRGLDRLFDISVNAYNTKVIDGWAGSPAKVTEHHSGSQLHEQQIVVKDWSASGELTVEIDYRPSTYTEGQIDLLFDRLVTLIDAVLAAPDMPAARLSLLKEAEQAQLRAFLSTRADYPRDKTVTQLFEEQASRAPERTAVVFGPERLTYRQLDEQAKRLAAWLGSRGIGTGDAVGLFARHSLETIVAILAVLKAGAAYVPIDPDYPAARIDYMLADAGCGLLLANTALPEGVDYAGPVGWLNDAELYASETVPSLNAAAPEDLAYIIYTSGSTGKPKGVMIAHQGLVNYIWWAKRQYVRDEHEVFPLYSSLAFDLTVTSVFTPLVAGGRIDIYRDDQSAYVLDRIMEDNRATVVKLTPSHLSLLQYRDNRGSAVRRFIVGGEQLRTDLARRIYDSFGGRIEIYNEYGPTETVVGCMIHRYDPERDIGASVPIGVPAANVGIHLLDCDGNPVPEQVLGEIYVTGDGLARGYRNLPSLTAERFVPCPFLPGERMYRTGDLARRLASDAIEYAGRADMQVKIRGHRIELGEIERTLAAHPAVREAVVIDRQTADGSEQLCAYVVRDADDSADSADLVVYLAGRLPAFMVPAQVVPVTSIPLNANGKVDRARLPMPKPLGSDVHAIRTDAVRPGTPEENVLLAVAKDVLQADWLTAEDVFHTRGGDSIKAIQLASRLRSRGFAIKVADVLAHPIFSEMAACLQPVGHETGRSGDGERCAGELRATPILDWFMTRPFAERHHYVQSVLLRPNGALTAGQVDSIIRQLVDRHDSLRLNLDSATGTLLYNDNPMIETVKTYDLKDAGEQERATLLASIGERLKASFRLERDALLKACLFELSPDDRRLLLVAHHLAVDAVSWSILLEEFGLLYQSLSLPEPIVLPATTAAYPRWAAHLRGRTEEAENERAYWQAIFEDEPYIRCDADGQETTGYAGLVTETLPPEQTTSLLKRASAAYGTNTQELLATALAAAVRDVFGIDRPVVELEGHGREPTDPSIDLSRTVGWFTSLYPIRLHAVADGDWATSVKSVKETLRGVPSKGLGFGLLTRLSRTLIDPGEGRRIRFNYVGELDSTLDASDRFSLAAEHAGADSGSGNPPTALLDITAMTRNGRLQLNVVYDRGKIRSETATAFAGCLAARTEELIRHCCDARERTYTPSDFATISLSQEALDSLYR